MTITIPKIELKPCKSNQIRSHGYDPESRTLAICFHKKENGKEVPGSIYHYANFSPEDYERFCKVESLGKHFGAHIKGGKFKFTKVS